MGVDVLLELNNNDKNYIEDLGKFRPVLKAVINVRTSTRVLDIGSPLENLTHGPLFTPSSCLGTLKSTPSLQVHSPLRRGGSLSKGRVK